MVTRIAPFLFLTACLAGTAYADDSAGKPTGKRQHAPVTVTKELDKSSPKLAETATRDAASGLPTGKRQHKPVSVTKPVDKASPALRDAASGMATGKRQHKPVSVTKPVDKATPMLSRASDDEKDVAKKTNKSEAARSRRPD